MELAETKIRLPKFWRIALLVIAAIVVIAVVGLYFFWPFRQSKVMAALKEDWPGEVRIGRYRSTWFPRPGFIAENLSFEKASNRSREPLRVTIQTAVVQTAYGNLFLRPGYLTSAALSGVRVKVPVYESATQPEPTPQTAAKPDTGQSAPASDGPSTTLASVTTQDAVLEVDRSKDQPPLIFNVHALTLHQVRGDKPMDFDGTLTNPIPKGEIHVHGSFGPWVSRDLAEIPLSTSYTFDHADLGVFSGIEGILESSGSMNGKIGGIDSHGTVDIPDFQLKRNHHPVHLKAEFQAKINGMNGDVELPQVNANYGKTAVRAEGKIAATQGVRGKTTSVHFEVNNGQIEDVLYLFNRDKTPAMTGPVKFNAQVRVPPGEGSFLDRVDLDGSFAITHGVLTNSQRQHDVDTMSQRASGTKAETTPRVSEDLTGHLLLRHQVASFEPVQASVPGARVSLDGDYRLRTEKVNLHGDMQTDLPLSKQATGIKAILMKPLDPLFKKKSHGASVPVGITGSWDHPHFGLDLTQGGAHSAKSTAPGPQEDSH